MLETILSLYITLMSVIFAGVANMAFCKYPTYQRLNIPMDAGRILSDGKRLFGQNKTWKGFIGMILFGRPISDCLGTRSKNYSFP